MPLLDSLQKLSANPENPIVYASTRNFKGSARAGYFHCFCVSLQLDYRMHLQITELL